MQVVLLLIALHLYKKPNKAIQPNSLVCFFCTLNDALGQIYPSNSIFKSRDDIVSRREIK